MAGSGDLNVLKESLIPSSSECKSFSKVIIVNLPPWGSLKPLATWTVRAEFQLCHWGARVNHAVPLDPNKPQEATYLPAIQETRVWSLGWEDPLEKRMVTHSSDLAWRIPWTEEPGGSQRVRHNWATNTYLILHQNLAMFDR